MTRPVLAYGTFGAWGMPSVSPFVIKLLTWLRMTGVPHEVRPGNPLRAPKGKVPYADIDGEIVGDSQVIIDRLTVRNAVTIDAHLSPVQVATGHAIRRMLEEGTYFHTLRFRWLEEDGWPIQQAAFLPHMPPVLGHLILGSIRRKLRKSAWLQGSGRHDRATAAAIAVRDWEAVRDLFVGPYLFGDRPSSFDAMVGSFLWANQGYPLESPVRQAASSPVLVEYVTRLRREYWPELEQKLLPG